MNTVIARATRESEQPMQIALGLAENQPLLPSQAAEPWLEVRFNGYAISSGVGMSATWASSPMTIVQDRLKLNCAARHYYDLLPIVRNRKRMHLSKSIAAKAQWKAEIQPVNRTDCHDSAAL